MSGDQGMDIVDCDSEEEESGEEPVAMDTTTGGEPPVIINSLQDQFTGMESPLHSYQFSSSTR